jgi:hypothetical protein
VRLLLAILAAMAFAGCGPVQSTSALVEADVEIEAARAAGAATSAPYEFTGAEAYLHKAREVVGYARYEPATEFASKARDLAQKARKKALETTQKEAP